ncbi:uncharacterized protein LOC135370090 isoform X2 [Ornithodoros turicata]|uniref:uncharacterized protein LOC135370090 isoform X2 n=1 Tax=Ornithodoros turicata TaxID=34597 RepID=UPI003139030D
MAMAGNARATGSPDSLFAEGYAYSVRSWGGRIHEQTKECRSLSHLGILMPLYLSPIAYQGTMRSLCLYCILMPLFLWAFHSLPMPVVALLHIINLPLFGIMSTEQMAWEYLSTEGVTVVLLAMLVISVDSGTTFIPRVAYSVVSRFGMRRRNLFITVCAAALTCTMLCAQTVVAVPLLLVVDRVLCVLYHENLDNIVQIAVVSQKTGNYTVSAARSIQSPNTDPLLNKLAQVVGALKDEKNDSKTTPKHNETSEDEVRPPVVTSVKDGAETVMGLDQEKEAKRAAPCEKPQGEHRTEQTRKVFQIRTPDDKTPEAVSPEMKKSGNTVKVVTLDDTVANSPSDMVAASPGPERLSATRMRKASILKLPGSSSVIARKMSSGVDFKQDSLTVSPAAELADRPPGRLLSERPRSRMSSCSNTSVGDESLSEWLRSRKYARRISLRYPATGRESVGEDSTHGRTSRLASSAGTSTTLQAAAAAAASARDDMTRRRAELHSAFLWGPSLMTVLGNICSIWFFPVGDVLEKIRQDPRKPRLTPVRLWSITAPVSLVASLFTGIYLYFHLRLFKHEPADSSTEHMSVMEAARNKLKSAGPANTIDRLACVYIGVFCVTFYPLVIMGHDAMEMQLRILCGMVLASTLLNHVDQNVVLSRNNIGLKMPWGVLFVIGAVQIISLVVEKYSLLEEMFQGIPPNFWQNYSPMSVQVMLACISAGLAETMDRNTISRIIIPIVTEIAARMEVYPLYYAIPVAVAASTNVIMPISTPLVILHEIGHVPMWQMVLLVGAVLLSMNTTAEMIYSWGTQMQPDQ